MNASPKQLTGAGNYSAVRSFVDSWVKDSHRRQFYGEDYQAICHEFLNTPKADKLGISGDDEDICREIESGPHPACDCGFCESAPWE